jgi:3-oxoacyl-[acyl-carrier protein] reductase
VDLGLADKIAVVTGSSRGLGLASARALVAEGCRVVLCARGAETLAEAALEVEAAAKRPNMVAAVQADVSTPAGIELVINRTVDSFGGIDILVNNVGRAAGSDLLGTTDAEWQAAFDETLFPAIRASRLAIPHMKQRGSGSIVMIASIWGRESGGRMTYNAVKAAEISLAKALAQQLAPANIRVNSVAPGSIMFPGGSWHTRQQSDPAGIADMIKRELPFGRFGRADEVANLVVFLASNRASWISGACIVIDGCQGRSNI